MILLVAIAAVVALGIALVVAIGRDPGPLPVEVALGYEAAWDHLDFDTVYRLSGPELREGLERAEFVAVKREAHGRGRDAADLVASVQATSVVVDGDRAGVITKLVLRDGSVVHNEVGLVRRARVWQVVSYRLRPAAV